MVLPSPFKILERVAVRYRKGQIKESVRIKIPAFSFPKRRRPVSYTHLDVYKRQG